MWKDGCLRDVVLVLRRCMICSHLLSNMALTLDTLLLIFLFFFFSSRRRHTRLTCDWSSDVCSSDLAERPVEIGTDSYWAFLVELVERSAAVIDLSNPQPPSDDGPLFRFDRGTMLEIGRASCRERVEMWVGGGALRSGRGVRGIVRVG